MSIKREESGRCTNPGPEEMARIQRAAARDYYARMDELRRRQEEAHAEGLPALKRLVGVAQGGSGQCHHVRRFLLGLYNGTVWPFDLNRLRCLDKDLQDDCMALLRMDSSPRKEIHLYIEDGDAVFQDFWERETPEDFEDDVPL